MEYKAGTKPQDRVGLPLESTVFSVGPHLAFSATHDSWWSGTPFLPGNTENVVGYNCGCYYYHVSIETRHLAMDHLLQVLLKVIRHSQAGLQIFVR